MLKHFIISLVLTLLITGIVFSQGLPADSVKKIAQADVKKFKLSREDQKIFKADKSNFTSDLFKPGLAYTSNPSLLNDSVYVRTFRYAAFKKASNKRSTGHYVLLGTAGYIIASAIAVLVIILALGSK